MKDISVSLRRVIRLSQWGLSWPWLYGSWIYNYLCNQCLSPLMLLVQISIRARCTTLCDKVHQWLATGRWFSHGTPFSSTNKTECHDITEILLKVALNTIKQTNIYHSDLSHCLWLYCISFKFVNLDPTYKPPTEIFCLSSDIYLVLILEVM